MHGIIWILREAPYMSCRSCRGFSYRETPYMSCRSCRRYHTGRPQTCPADHADDYHRGKPCTYHAESSHRGRPIHVMQVMQRVLIQGGPHTYHVDHAGVSHTGRPHTYHAEGSHRGRPHTYQVDHAEGSHTRRSCTYHAGHAEGSHAGRPHTYHTFLHGHNHSLSNLFWAYIILRRLDKLIWTFYNGTEPRHSQPDTQWSLPLFTFWTEQASRWRYFLVHVEEQLPYKFTISCRWWQSSFQHQIDIVSCRKYCD